MARRQKSSQDIWDKAQTTAQLLHTQDELMAEQADRDRAQRSLLPLDKILDRPSDTRELKSEHVQSLAESIATLGLIEPLVTDNQGRLLAGGHRKAAIAWLKENDPKRFDQQFPDNLIPVRMMPFDGSENPERALEIEISENEKRRDYTPAEVRVLADRLRQAGYIDSAGRPKKGEKRLRPALEIIVGKSLRSVRRYLTEEKPVQVGQVSEYKLLKQAYQALSKWNTLTEIPSPEQQKLKTELDCLLPLIKKLCEQPAKPITPTNHQPPSQPTHNQS